MNLNQKICETESGKTLVFDIGGTNIKYGILDARGVLTHLEEAPTQAHLGGSAVLENVIRLAAECGKFQRIGVSTAGQVNRSTGSIIFATDNIPGYTGLPVGQILSDRLGVPVAVENDVNAAALGEAHFGAGRGFSHFLCVTYGTGIGGAIFIDRKLYTGRRGSAGEFGHFVTHVEGNACTCGFRGCYEVYASTTALIRRVCDVVGKTLDGREIFAACASNNAAVQECLDGWIHEVAVGLAGLIHIFEPEAILLGGGIMQEDDILCRLREIIPTMTMASYQDIKLARTALGNRAGMYGAYYAALHPGLE